jgi:glycosyltransferase involved in cell wall biosynthesis
MLRESPAQREERFRAVAATAGRGRIVQLVDSLGMGGAERVVAAYAPELRRLGFDVRVVALQERDGDPLAAALREAGIEVRLVRVDRLARLDQAAGVFRALARLKPDLIHAHLQFSGILGPLIGGALGVPVVATLHTLEHSDPSWTGKARFWLMHRLLAGRAARVVCLTPTAAALARSTALKRATLEVMANGIDLTPYVPRSAETRARLRAEFGIPRAAPLIVVVAVLRPLKGVDRLIAAMESIRTDHPAARLLVVGDGEARPALVEQVRTAGLEDAVVFAGRRDDIPEVLAAADVFVLPTLFDALPTVIMEAMAARLPVVASATGGIPDMVVDGVEGLLVPPGDVGALARAVSRLLADRELARALGTAARGRAERCFSLTGQAARQAELYDHLIAAGTPG